MKRWSLLKRIIWLFRLGIIGVSSVLKTVTGNPIHILDALAKPAQSLSVKLEPIQDLNGYDNPWPAGGGANKWEPFSGEDGGVVFTSQSDGTVLIQGTSSNSGWRTISTGYIALPYNGINAGDTVVLWSNCYAELRMYDSNKANIASKSSYNSTAQTLTIPSDTVYIKLYEGVQNGAVPQGEVINLTGKYFIGASFSAWTPFSNLCPISGHTDADVTRTGVNVWDEVWEVGGLNITTGQNNALTDRIRSKNYIPVTPNTEYRYVNGTNNLVVLYYDINKNYLGEYYYMNVNQDLKTTSSDCYYLRFYMVGAYGPTYNNDISINYPATDTEYHAYVGTTYPIPIGTTVYGGTLDVLTGVLTVDRANYNASDLTWSIRSGVGRFLSSTLVSTIKKPAQDSEYLNGFICSSYKADSYSDTDVNGNIGVSDAGRICICNTAFDQDLSGFTASLTGVTIIVPLATPQTIQLTPQQVELLQGENNLFSDGEMTLVYLADGNASDEEALNILLGGRYVNNHTADEPSDREALDILLGRTR